MANIEYKLFGDINLQDTFFDSLRQDYQGFNVGMRRKPCKVKKPIFCTKKMSWFVFCISKRKTPIDNTGITHRLWIQLKLGYFYQSTIKTIL
ncbi:hypothetical protein [Helicobacter mustelae]|nr:hypothetical protein [Helicobacter mustelae]SQH71954.1 Uncharacterised protein [Helicobacter mustelae]